MFDSFGQIRIVYMGTPSISAKVLEALLANGCNIVALIANEDKPVGRKKELKPVPTKEVALKYGIPVFQPHRIRLENDFLKELNPDLIITMAYGQIVPKEVLEAPKYGCLNLHGSLLPSYRGAAPIQRALIDAQEETGVTLMEMVEKMDAGRMYAKARIEIDENETYGSLCEKMSASAASLMLDNLLDYVNGKLEGEMQNEDEVTFAEKIKPEHEHLDIHMGAEAIRHWINGLSPTPGAYFYLSGKKVKVYEAYRHDGDYEYEDGTLLIEGKKLLLVSRKKAISLSSLQMEGKNVVDASSFLNGYRSLLSNNRFE